jgi:anti-sigma B factor antagonist
MSSQPPGSVPPSVEAFACTVEPEGEAVRVVPSGSLDMLTAPLLEARLREVTEAGSRRVVVDLRRLDFIDSTGLRLLLARDALARQDGFAFALIPGSPTIQRVFELTQTRDLLPFVDR